MRLLDSVKKIVLEEKRKFSKLKWSDYIGDKKIKLLSSYHQWFERHGDENYKTIKDIFFDKFIRNEKYRVGVPDELIIELFKKNISKIENSFDDPSKNRVIFVKKRNDNEDEVEFDYIEFILQKNEDNYEIITSSYSDDGKFLVLGFPIRTKFVVLERMIKPKYEIVYLD